MPPHRVLVVDDDEPTIHAITDVLENEGFTVVATNDPNVALRHALEHPFELVITDYHMPQLLGTDLLKTIRARRPHIATLLMSGSGVAPDRAAIDASIAKPFVVGELLAAVNRLLGAPEGEE